MHSTVRKKRTKTFERGLGFQKHQEKEETSPRRGAA